jgi:transposase
MKDGRTHLAHKAEHAVDMETGAVVAVTVQAANAGDTETIHETLPQAAEHIAAVAEGMNGEAGQTGILAKGPAEVVADKGYHSRAVIRQLGEAGVRTYISEPERRRQRWVGQAAEQSAVYGNRRRVRGERGQRLQRARGERLERINAHLYETGGMRRLHLRGRDNILKRLLIHVCGLNLGLVVRLLCGIGTPRGLQGRSLAHSAASYCILVSLLLTILDQDWKGASTEVTFGRGETLSHQFSLCPRSPRRFLQMLICTTGC